MGFPRVNISEVVDLKNDRLVVNASSLTNAQSVHTDIAMQPKLLLGSGFAINVAGTAVKLKPFAAMYTGGSTEPNAQVIATLEELSVSSNTSGSFGADNSLTIHVTTISLEAFQSAFKQAKLGRQDMIIRITIPTGMPLTGQYYFHQAEGVKPGKWGDALTFKTQVEFVTRADPFTHVTGSYGSITFTNMTASNNFDVSIATESTDDTKKIVAKILANNQAAA